MHWRSPDTLLWSGFVKRIWWWSASVWPPHPLFPIPPNRIAFTAHCTVKTPCSRLRTGSDLEPSDHKSGLLYANTCLLFFDRGGSVPMSGFVNLTDYCTPTVPQWHIYIRFQTRPDTDRAGWGWTSGYGYTGCLSFVYSFVFIFLYHEHDDTSTTSKGMLRVGSRSSIRLSWSDSDPTGCHLHPWSETTPFPIPNPCFCGVPYHQSCCYEVGNEEWHIANNIATMKRLSPSLQMMSVCLTLLVH